MKTTPEQYLLYFLGILVDRAGGELVIGRLSEYVDQKLQLTLTMDTEQDTVTLRLSGGKLDD